MRMVKHPERVTLNLVLNGEPFDCFMVTKSSWEHFLQRLSEKDLPTTPAPRPSEAHRCTA